MYTLCRWDILLLEACTWQPQKTALFMFGMEWLQSVWGLLVGRMGLQRPPVQILQRTRGKGGHSRCWKFLHLFWQVWFLFTCMFVFYYIQCFKFRFYHVDDTQSLTQFWSGWILPTFRQISEMSVDCVTADSQNVKFGFFFFFGWLFCYPTQHESLSLIKNPSLSRYPPLRSL